MQFQNKVSADLSSKILTVGPEYRNHRGGIGAVIESYSRNFEIFNFISTYRDGSVIARAFIFLRGWQNYFSYWLETGKLKYCIYMELPVEVFIESILYLSSVNIFLENGLFIIFMEVDFRNFIRVVTG